MSSVLQKPIVLSLNRAWQIIGQRTVEQALVAMNGGRDGIAPALGIDICYPKLPDGSWDFEHPVYLNPVPWKEWVTLPVRDCDFSVHTPKMEIRVPTVIVSANFDKMPVRRPTLSRNAIRERDGGVCQYSGEFIGNNGNLDHVIPLDRGGKSTFENLVWSKPHLNSMKANRLPEEAGLKLLRVPKAPKPVPVSATIKQAVHVDWNHFLLHRRS